jgi:Leucine-rich repeat (LRR) protein
MLELPKESKRAVKQLELSSHSLVSLDFIPQEFSNLELLNVNLNRIKNIDYLANFKRLKILYVLSNSLTEFPPALCDLHLQLLNIGQNQIKALPA